jgi:hypothetical protein
MRRREMCPLWQHLRRRRRRSPAEEKAFLGFLFRARLRDENSVFFFDNWIGIDLQRLLWRLPPGRADGEQAPSGPGALRSPTQSTSALGPERLHTRARKTRNKMGSRNAVNKKIKNNKFSFFCYRDTVIICGFNYIFVNIPLLLKNNKPSPEPPPPLPKVCELQSC